TYAASTVNPANSNPALQDNAVNLPMTITVADTGPYADTRTTVLTYDAFGNIQTMSLYEGTDTTVAANLISTAETDYDATGLLRQQETIAPPTTAAPSGMVLTQALYQYDADGTLSGVIDGNNTLTINKYNTAGLLTETD